MRYIAWADARALRSRVADGALIEVHPRIFFKKDGWESASPEARHRRLLHALYEQKPERVFCSFSAALIHGLPVSWHHLGEAHVVTPQNAPVRGSGILKCHPSKTIGHTLIDGISVTPYMETVVDCLISSSFMEGLAVADAVLRVQSISREALFNAIDRAGKGRHGISRARRCALWADGRVESAGESIARGTMIEMGIIPSDLQYVVDDPVEPWRRSRVDFLFLLRNGALVLGELDGMEKYQNGEMLHGRTTLEALIGERQRESHLTLGGVPVLRFTMHDVRRPDRLRFLLAAAGVTPESLAQHDYRDMAPRPDKHGMVNWTAYRGA